MTVTASMLYDLVACPHRVGRDLFADPKERDPPNPFVELLWERGSAVEAAMVAGLQAPYLDLENVSRDERSSRTREAMEARVALIYGGPLAVDDLLGEPDLLRLEGAHDIPIDIKSGSGEMPGLSHSSACSIARPIPSVGFAASGTTLNPELVCSLSGYPVSESPGIVA